MSDPDRALSPPDYPDETDAEFWQRREDALQALDTEEIQDMGCMAIDEDMAKLIKRLVMLIPNPTACERQAIGNAFVDRLMDERERYLEANNMSWIHITDRLPPALTHVALCSDQVYENAPGVKDSRAKDVGYIADIHGYRYWSIRGERGCDLDAYPWWHPLPRDPD